LLPEPVAAGLLGASRSTPCCFGFSAGLRSMGFDVPLPVPPPDELRVVSRVISPPSGIPLSTQQHSSAEIAAL
jgi:hypothetical protein